MRRRGPAAGARRCGHAAQPAWATRPRLMDRPPGDASGDTGTDARTAAPTARPPPPELELLVLRDGLPDVVETPEALAAAVADLAGRHRPDRARRRARVRLPLLRRAYLIQLRRAGSTTWLVDPIAFDDLEPLREVLDTDEWILHAASQDLACLREVGLEPRVAVRHRARRPAARPPPRRPGRPGRGDLREADAQGALGGRLVAPTAAPVLAGLRRPRRRGAGRDPRRAGRGARASPARPSGPARSSST